MPTFRTLPEYYLERSFTLTEVAEILGIRRVTLWQQINRGTVPIRNARHGTGTEITLAGFEVITLAAAQTLSALGLPVGVSHTIAGSVEDRAKILLTVGDPRGAMRLVIYPTPGDWQADALFGDKPLDPDLPIAVVVLHADRLILETARKLEFAINSREGKGIK